METNRFKKSFGGREKFFTKKSQKTKKNLYVGDCVVRAIAHATKKPYKEVWDELMDLSKKTLQMPNEEINYNSYLKLIGWEKQKPFRNQNNKTVRVAYFPAKPKGKYIISTRNHLTSIVNRVHLDTWDCGGYRANSFWIKK